jgi:transmembrane sensor
MTMADPEADRDGPALDREAAHWFARMRGPGADADRVAFQAWLAKGPEHRAAYSRTAEIFAMGKLLAKPEPAGPEAIQRRRAAPVLAAIGAAVLVFGGLGLWRPDGVVPGTDESPIVAVAERHSIVTGAGETRVVRLGDGSVVRLASDALIEVDIDSARRDLQLRRGTARFEVAHDERPFVVLAGGGRVTARGTIFEVALTGDGRVDVHLVEGAVDVALPSVRPTSVPVIRKLVSGERVSFSDMPGAASPGVSPSGTALGAPTGTVREFDAASVADVIALANRDAARPILLGNAALAARRVSGRFRIDDTGLLARRLGALLGEGVDASRMDAIVLGTRMSVADPSAGRPGSSLRDKQ